MLLFEKPIIHDLNPFNQAISKKNKANLGQFFTPEKVANFMASLFAFEKNAAISLLDAGAGEGALSKAFIEKVSKENRAIKNFDITAYEVDPMVTGVLNRMLSFYQNQFKFNFNVFNQDFIEAAVSLITTRSTMKFTHAILNPPYKKINSSSTHRQLLRGVGIETVNLYSAFVALVLELMQPKGQIVAIIPRSFCNGPYYKPFREFILKKGAIKQIHLFKARDKAFKEDSVLQENVILLLTKEAQQSEVIISTSTDQSFFDYNCQTYPFERVIAKTDSELFIHIPTFENQNILEFSEIFHHSLKDLGVEVSTGPVVDFRLKEHLREDIELNTVPLLYPNNFSSSKEVEWPKEKSKKPCAIVRNEETERWLYPNGFYTVVRRFSSKEEKRRVVASITNPQAIKADKLGFENHLNIFHSQKKGISEELARGLAAFLNLEIVDDYFRQFNGHTQVNATDLKMLKYPSKQKLVKLGEWSKKQGLSVNKEAEAMALGLLHG